MSVGGTWNVDQGLTALWDSQGLDALFRENWPADKRDDFSSLEWGQGGEEQPYPYCSAEVGESIPDHRSGGTSQSEDTRIEVYNVPLLLVIYGRDKKEARDLGRQVATIVETCSWDACDGWHETTRQGDSLAKDTANDVWFCLFRYLVRIEHEKANVTGG